MNVLGYICGLPIYETREVKHDPHNGQFTSGAGGSAAHIGKGAKVGWESFKSKDLGGGWKIEKWPHPDSHGSFVLTHPDHPVQPGKPIAGAIHLEKDKKGKSSIPAIQRADLDKVPHAVAEKAIHELVHHYGALRGNSEGKTTDADQHLKHLASKATKEHDKSSYVALAPGHSHSQFGKIEHEEAKPPGKMKAEDHSQVAWEKNTTEAHLHAAKAHETEAAKYDKNGNTSRADKSRYAAEVHHKYSVPEVIEHEKHATEWASKLTKDEEKARQAYQGHGYQDMNGALREGKGQVANQYAGINGLRPVPPRTTKNIALLDSALAKGGAHSQLEAKRLMHATPELVTALKPGATFTDHGYMSVSLKGGDFSSYMREGKQIIVNISIPKGTKGGIFPNGGKQPLNEFVLPRGTSVRITRVHTDEQGHLHVWSEIV